MFRHNLLLTFRTLLRFKGSFFINLIGLSTGVLHQLYSGSGEINLRTYFSNFIGISVFALFFCTQSAFAQHEDYFQYTKDGHKGYWQLKTNPATQCTEVAFYDEQGELVYSELLRGKYIRLNKRNLNVLNTHLFRLITNTLVASEVKADNLQAHIKPAIEEIIESTSTGKPTQASVIGYLSSDLRYEVYNQDKAARLMVRLENPAKERTVIRLKNSRGHVLYTYQTQLVQSLNRIYLYQLEEGMYTLVIHGRRKKFTQKIEIIAENEAKRTLLLPN